MEMAKKLGYIIPESGLITCPMSKQKIKAMLSFSFPSLFAALRWYFKVDFFLPFSGQTVYLFFFSFSTLKDARVQAKRLNCPHCLVFVNLMCFSAPNFFCTFFLSFLCTVVDKGFCLHLFCSIFTRCRFPKQK